MIDKLKYAIYICTIKKYELDIIIYNIFDIYYDEPKFLLNEVY